MSSFINKAKDKIEAALNQDSTKGDNPRSDNYGSHGSNVVNKADPRIDSDRDGRNDPTSRVGGYGQTQGHDQYGHTQGAGGFASSDTYGSNTNDPGYDNSRSTNTGPHGSNVLNKADPRVDSDRDNRNDPTSRIGGVGHTQQYGDNYGQTGGAGGLATSDTGYASTGTGSQGYGSTVGTGTHGYSEPGSGYDNTSSTTGHRSNFANKLDPRVDETTGTHHTGGGHGTAPVHHSTTSGGYDNSGSTNTGPHNNNLMNKLDPRVDSDRDNRNDPSSRVGGYGTQGDNYGHSTGIGGHHSTTGTTGGYGAGTTTGATGGYNEGYGQGRTTEGYGGSDNSASYGTGRNTGEYGSGNTTGGYGDNSYTPGSGTAPNTAGPHNSDMLNKLDPRVDSDMDGSKTYGGNTTHR